jgi:hypothetical protein
MILVDADFQSGPEATTVKAVRRHGTGRETTPERTAKGQPTRAPPGSVERVQVMIEREAAGLCIFHDGDVGFAGWNVGNWTPLG